MASTSPAVAPWSLDDFSDGSECEFTGPASDQPSPDSTGFPKVCAQQSLTPSHRGTYGCPCIGEVVIMLGHYGWLATPSQIDHPAVSKNGGRIYVQKRDIVNGMTLVEGDKVAFYLYFDAWGLGAEAVRLHGWGSRAEEGRMESQVQFGMNVKAAEFVPGAHQSVAAFPAWRHAARPPTMSPQIAMSPGPNNVFVNAAYWSDDSDEDEVCSVASDRSCDGDVEDVHVMTAAQRKDLKVAKRVLRKAHVRAISHGSSSTSVGSDSEGQDDSSASSPTMMTSPPPGLSLPGLSPPPGLSQLGVRAVTPPPGLRHPGLPPPGLSLA